jgi:hypothetical protein
MSMRIAASPERFGFADAASNAACWPCANICPPMTTPHTMLHTICLDLNIGHSVIKENLVTVIIAAAACP